eukprot:GHVU01074697.1.p2 GENE.GHVU01074697.1~~GHVU01074697.1.p2  ORF type:complete len:140 (-),score=6.13 GHVU01074697.1:55-474(-)
MDSLEIGNQLSPGWSRIHMSVWALMGSPLILGHDIKNADPYALEILMNERVIAIDQDRSPPGKRLAVVPDEPRVVQDRRTGQLFTVPTHWGSFWVSEWVGRWRERERETDRRGGGRGRHYNDIWTRHPVSRIPDYAGCS